MTLYFIYSIDDLARLNSARAEPRAAPYSIAWNAARRLRRLAAWRSVPFEYRNLDDARPIPLKNGDVVIGHPWWSIPHAPMNRVLDDPRTDIYRAVIMPFTPFATTQPDELCRYFERADHLFLIQGRYWYYRTFQSTEFPHYAQFAPKVTRLDTAINPCLHPFLKRHWNPPGKRRWLLLGHDAPAKGLDYAIRLAAACGAQVGHCGSVTPATAAALDAIGAKRYGGVAFTPDAIEYLANTYDFFVTCGRADANPTTLLEATSWGLLSFCTPQSGYHLDRPFINIPLDNIPAAAAIMNTWQYASHTTLLARQTAMRHALRPFYWRHALRPLLAHVATLL